MSLDASLSIAFSSLRVTESQLATSSANVTNADKAGYTTKKYDVSYTSYGEVSTPTSGITIGDIDYALSKTMVGDINESGYYSVINSGLDVVSTALGTTDGDNTINSDFTTLQSALETLKISPDDTSQKENVVAAAEVLATDLNSLSDTIQEQRLNANKSIETSVKNINDLLTQLDDLNEKIQDLSNLGKSTANLEDDRMVALESLSEEIGVNYFFDSSNNLQIYSDSGTVLLNSTAHTLSYTATSYVTDETLYPGGFDGITVGGKDITSSIDGGKLGGYIELRDTILVNTQDALDEIATTVMSTVNSALSLGTSYPAPSTLTGQETFSSSDSLSATGSLRIAVVDDLGEIQSYNDIDLSTVSNIAGLVSTIDALSNVSASLDSDGHLVITSDNSDYGIALNQMDSSLGSGAKTFSSYFGINTLFDGKNASDIHISDTLVSDYTSLATGALSNSATLAVGDKGITSGNVDALTDLISVLSSNVSFAAAGDFNAQTTTVSNYISGFLSHVANAADNASNKSDSAQSTYETTKSTLENATGVNIDEETIKITEYQNQYEAAATIVSTIQDLFSTLLEAVN